MIRVSIPVEPHVLKYLNQRYGAAHTVSLRSFIGKEVIEALQKNYEKPDMKLDRVNLYTLFIPEFYFKKRGHSVARNTRQHLGISMGILFDENMCSYLDIQVSKGKKALPELKAFLRFHNITEDDVKVETLYKVYQRHCKQGIKAQKKIA
ncbi:hypothetical protein [Flavobacterium beibuense]|uniref:hypothetical protein n=1 Tax=Flavobacterium beibuense TaxID=657326 RepID=UPI003A923D5A